MKGVGVIVAPYEADAQLAYLLKQGFVDVVVTEDSDLIVFGCQKVGLNLFFSRLVTSDHLQTGCQWFLYAVRSR